LTLIHYTIRFNNLFGATTVARGFRPTQADAIVRRADLQCINIIPCACINLACGNHMAAWGMFVHIYVCKPTHLFDPNCTLRCLRMAKTVGGQWEQAKETQKNSKEDREKSRIYRCDARTFVYHWPQINVYINNV